MNTLSKSALAFIALLLTIPAFASMDSVSGNTTCYIFKKDKLQKKTTCQFTISEGWSGYDGVFGAEYVIQGYGNIKYSQSYNHNNNKTKTSLNGKPATSHDRDLNSLKKLKKSQKDGVKYLECYKNSTLEICSINTYRAEREFGDLTNVIDDKKP